MTEPAAPLPPTPELETPRLVLRPLALEDAPAIQRLFPQWEVVRRLAARFPWPYPDDGAARHVAETVGSMSRGEKFSWAIFRKADPRTLIGCIDLSADDGVSREQRGFWLDPAWHGQGLMTEAADAVTRYAFVELGWPHIWVSNAEDNPASSRIKEKQGATLVERSVGQYVGGEAPKLLWRIDRDAWLARQSPA